jgi:hypothetical protein
MSTREKIGIAYWIGWLVFMIIFFYADNINRYRSSEKVKAVVVDKLWGRGAGYRTGGRDFQYPQMQFTYRDSTYLFAQSHNILGSYNIGKKLTVYFPEGEPGKAKIYSFITFWISLSQLFFGFMIAVFPFMMVIFRGWYIDFKKQYKGQ